MQDYPRERASRLHHNSPRRRFPAFLAAWLVELINFNERQAAGEYRRIDRPRSVNVITTGSLFRAGTGGCARSLPAASGTRAIVAEAEPVFQDAQIFPATASLLRHPFREVPQTLFPGGTERSCPLSAPITGRLSPYRIRCIVRPIEAGFILFRTIRRLLGDSRSQRAALTSQYHPLSTRYDDSRRTMVLSIRAMGDEMEVGAEKRSDWNFARRRWGWEESS